MSISSVQPKKDPPKEQLSFWERVEAYVTRLSTKNNFWHRVCSLIWLPFAFRSGISIRRMSGDKFSLVLPFKRSNRNFYNAMAGAALLGNSEVAAGMFLFKHCGSDYAVVCKNMSYKFLRPCYGPAVYNVREAEEIESEVTALMDKHEEFNIDFTMDITQILQKRGKEVRVGRCDITFHCTPKSMIKERADRRKARSTP
jgi:acyl-coenzyme A thioesterase PaaI-like protein